MNTLVSAIYFMLACLIFLLVCGWTIYILGDLPNEEKNDSK